MPIREVNPKILDRENEDLVCMEKDAANLSNWIAQMRRGCNYSTDQIRPLNSTYLDCIKADAQSILNHIKNIQDQDYVSF